MRRAAFSNMPHLAPSKRRATRSLNARGARDIVSHSRSSRPTTPATRSAGPRPARPVHAAPYPSRDGPASGGRPSRRFAAASAGCRGIGGRGDLAGPFRRRKIDHAGAACPGALGAPQRWSGRGGPTARRPENVIKTDRGAGRCLGEEAGADGSVAPRVFFAKPPPGKARAQREGRVRAQASGAGREISARHRSRTITGRPRPAPSGRCSGSRGGGALGRP